MMTRGQFFRLERRASEYTGEKSCNRCGACCMAGPCQLADMHDVQRLAGHFGLSAAETIRQHLDLEWQEGGATVVPHRKTDLSCSLYDDVTRTCTAQDAKPTGGQRYECWTTRGANLPPYLWNGDMLDQFYAATT